VRSRRSFATCLSTWWNRCKSARRHNNDPANSCRPVAQTVEDLKQANEATHSRLKAFVLPKHRRVLKTFKALVRYPRVSTKRSLPQYLIDKSFGKD